MAVWPLFILLWRKETHYLLWFSLYLLQLSPSPLCASGFNDRLSQKTLKRMKSQTPWSELLELEAASHTRTSYWRSLWQILRMCISNKLPDRADMAPPGPPLPHLPPSSSLTPYLVLGKRTLFSISCNIGLVVINSFISPSYLKDNFFGYIILSWWFPFPYFEYLILFSPGL